VRVIPNGVAMPPRPGSRPPHARFLVSGRIAPSKRLEAILEAFARASQGLREPELHIVGQAEPRDARYASGIVAAASALPVRFRGALPGLEHLSEPFTATIVLGTHQGCPNAVLEAMAAGIPVIANASGGTGELVRDGETGWLLSEAAGREELERAMRDCASAPERADRFAARARDRVARHFSLEAMASSYLDCLSASVS